MILRSRTLDGLALLAALLVATRSLSSISGADAASRGAVFAVENTYDSGAGSLREAILDANATPGADTIVFDIPFEGPHVIELASPLPTITDAVTVDGYAQRGTKPGSRKSISLDLQVADDISSVRIVIDGAGAGHADGLSLAAGNCIVRGLVLRRFDGNGISLTGAGDNLVEDNLVSDNAGAGIAVLSGSRNRITGNSIFSNHGGGIDLAADGKNEIDVGDLDAGPNDLQNAPSLLSVRRLHCDGIDSDPEESCGAADRGGITAISGTIESFPNESFSLEFFATPPGESGVPAETALAASTQQGKTFLGEALVSTGPEGRAPFTINLPTVDAIPSGTLITATATDSRGNTSEYSNAVAAPASVIPWAAAVSGNWNDPTKWTGGLVPGASDDAQITVDGTYTVNLNASATVNSLTVGGASGTQTFTVPGNTLTLNAASAVGPNGAFQMSGGILTGTGTLTVSSELAWTGGEMTGAGITNANGGMSISGNTHDLTSLRALNTDGTTTWIEGAIRVGAGASITNHGTWDCQTDLTLGNLGGASAFTNSAAATFKKSAGAGTTAVNTPFNNSGALSVESGTISLGGGGISSGAFTGTGSGTLQFGGGTHTLGVGSSVGVPTVVFIGGTVNVDGSYNATSGTTVSGGTANFDPAGTVSSVGGALTVSNGVANFTSGEAINSTTLSISGGILQGTDTVTSSGLTTWTGGEMTGAGITNANGGMSISGNTHDLTSLRVLNTDGTTTWTDGAIRVGAGASITNHGTWDCQTDLTLGNLGGAAAFTNSAVATFKKSAGAGTTAVNTPFNNSGALSVESGTISLGGGGTSSGAFTGTGSGTLQFGGGTHTLGVGSSVGVPTVVFIGGTVNVDGSYNATSGTTVSGGTANFDPAGTVSSVGGALTVSNGVANFTSGEAINSTTLSISGGILQGTDTVTSSGLTTWTGGEMTGAGITNANGGMSISGNTHDLTSLRVLNTDGTTTWTDGAIRVGAGASITNHGTWDCQTDLTLGNLGGAAAFTNSAVATFKKSAGAGTIAVNTPFNNSGALSVESGTISLGGGGISSGAFTGTGSGTLQFGGGTHTLGVGSSVGVPTVVFIGGTVNVDGSYNATSGTTVSGGTANFDPAGTVSSVGGALTVSNGVANFTSGEAINSTTLSISGGILQGTDTVTSSGLTTWTGGEMTGAGITNANGGMSISGNTHDLTSLRVLNTDGTTTWTEGAIRVGAGASITNHGTWDCQTDLTLGNLGGASAFTNSAAATFKKSAGAGTTAVNTPFTNAGNVLALSGTLTFSNGYPQSAGVTTLNGGTIMSPSPLDIQGGVLQGIGTLPEGVSSAGQTRPGLSPGILGISGNYTQASAGSFAVEVGGLTAGTGHDRLDVAGAATLAGALHVTLVNGFIPNPGDELTILTCGSRTGTFSTTSFPSFPGIQWRVDYFDTAVKLVALLVPAGRVPGDLDAETPLLAAKSGSNIKFTWTGTCVPGDIDFAVYEGELVDFTSHVPAVCSTGGATTATFAPAAGDHYYLVAAHNGHEEGSYGYDSTGAERALSIAECHPQNIASCP